MGMKIIETSGTFNPADYGLTAGDVLDIICVSGGYAGWASSDNDRVDPGDSSFGSYVSSANGIQMGQAVADGCGAGGYMPGVPFYGGNGGAPVGLAGTLVTPVSPYCNTGGFGNKGATGSRAEGRITAGGNGYGAGSAGDHTVSGTVTQGGDAGRIAFGSAVLADASPITVTVGAAGVNNGQGMAGAPGVVVVFW